MHSPNLPNYHTIHVEMHLTWFVFRGVGQNCCVYLLPRKPDTYFIDLRARIGLYAASRETNVLAADYLAGREHPNAVVHQPLRWSFPVKDLTASIPDILPLLIPTVRCDGGCLPLHSF